MSNPEEALVAAKAAYKADKKNKELKKAYKEAQAAATAWKAEQEAKAAKKAAKKAKKEKAAAEAAAAPVEPEKKKKNKKRKAEEEAEAEPAATKKPKVDLASLQAAAKEAKAAHKANPSDDALKAAYKAARKAVKDFQPEEAEAETPAETPAAEAEEDDLSALKKTNGSSNATDTPVPANANEKLFLGNLSWDIDDESITEFFKDCGTLTDIFWLEDKESGKFKGCGFVTFETKEQAAKAQAKSGEIVMGRDIKIEFANPRPGGDRGGKGGKGKGGKGGKGAKPLSEKPADCTTVFAGNLSFDIDEDGIREFAKECGEVKSVRWVTNRDTGDFKGCGFIEFWDSESVDKFVKKNGEDLLGRSVRLDYAASRG